MRFTHRVLYGITVLALVVVWSGAVALARDRNPPSTQQVAFASEVSDLLLNELLAALFTEFNETTPDNVEQGQQAISLIFNDLNRNIRLIGPFEPLGGSNNRASGSFERQALEHALSGQAHTAVQEENSEWFYRRSIPLSNTFHEACVLCHTNFTPDFFASTDNPGQWVGALILSVPIATD